MFVGTGAPKGKDLEHPGPQGGRRQYPHRHRLADLGGVRPVDKIGKRVVVIGGGNTAMDCCRTALRLGAEKVTVTVRSPRKVMKASDWEIKDALYEGIPILDNHAPKAFVIKDGKLAGVSFEKMVETGIDAKGRPKLEASGEEVAIDCDDVLMAIGQENAFPWIERDIGLEFDEWDMPKVDRKTFMSTRPGVFFGGDAAWGPENIIWAVSHGHQAAISIDAYCNGRPIIERPAPGATLVSQKMGIHEWSYSNDYDRANRIAVPHAELEDLARRTSKSKSSSASTTSSPPRRSSGASTATCRRCSPPRCASSAMPAWTSARSTASISSTMTTRPTLRAALRVPALNTTQDIYVSESLKTGRIMAKDEDVCLHCGLCAERCPTGAWDMQKFIYVEAQASKLASRITIPIR